MNDRTLEALQEFADAGPDPDEDAAWERITSGIRADEGRRRRNRLMAVGSAIAATAAAVVLVASFDTGTDQAVDVGPAGPSSSTSRMEDPDSQEGTPIALPADPLVVTGQNWSTIHVLDAATGERVSTPLGSFVEGVRVHDPTITADGTIYATLHDDRESATSIIRTTWDATGDYETVEFDDLPPDFERFGAPAVSADGRTLAVSVTTSDPDALNGPFSYGSLVILDTTTGIARHLSWPTNDERARLAQPAELSFSPDGSRLAFLNVHDTDGTEAFDGFVLDVDAESIGEAELVGDDLWDLTFVPGGGLLAQVGSTQADSQLRYVGGGPDIGIAAVDGLLRLESSLRSIIAMAGDQWTRYDPATDAWLEMPYGDWAN